MCCLLIVHAGNISAAGNGKSVQFHIGLFNPVCSEFEVRIQPDQNIESNITNIQFTLKWPENTVELINLSSDYQLVQQGPVFIHSGYNYAVFVAIPLGNGLPVNMTAGTEYVILSYEHDQSGSGDIDFTIADDDWANSNNGNFYVELYGSDHTGIIYQQAFFSYAGSCKKADIQIILQGAFDPDYDYMRTDINTAGNLPQYQPYSRAPWNYFGSENVTAFPDTIVDWVLVELRDADDPTILVDRQAALLSKHGQVLRTDFTMGLNFGNHAGNYYLVVKHRNHIPVMSGNPVALPNSGTPYDFSDLTYTQPYLHNDPLPSILELEPPGSGKYGMIAGDVNSDGELKYMGAKNDRYLILSTIIYETGNESLTGSIAGYFNEDVNLNNAALYLGPENDRAIILRNLEILTGSTALHNVYTTVVPEIVNP
jgi:hypothetical protein